MPGLKAFLSCVSAQFKACRNALASDLRAIGCEVRVQEDFQQGPGTLLERLEEYVAGCDRVVALVGDAYGFEAPAAAARAGAPQRSYTQWEYSFALGERLDGARAERKELYVYLASEPYLREHPVSQSTEQAERQRAFVAQVKAAGKHYGMFDSVDGVCRLVLRDGWRMSERPRRPSNLPYPSLGPLFKGREGFLDDLHGRLRREKTHAAAIVSQQAIHGLGGVGKTRLAVEYALRHEAEYCALLFVMAESAEDLRRNLAALCDPLVLDMPEREAREEDVRVTAALRWLSEHNGWLLIFDNVDTPAAQAEVERLLAQLRGGHVLVTSRRTNWSAGVEPLALDVLAEDDAVAFLLERTNGARETTPSDPDDARDLAQELGGLALALEQAGAFIATRHESLGGYLRRWREREKKVREWHDEALMHYPRSIAVTWDTSVSQLDAGVLALLRMLCWLAPEPIPRALLETDEAKRVLEQAVAVLVEAGEKTEGGIASTDVEDALARLAGLSLVKWEGGNALRLHRLVGEITRQRVPADQRQATLAAVLGIVNAYLPGNPQPWDVRSWPRWEPMRAHVAAVATAADAVGIAQPTSRLMDMLGGLLRAKCVWAEAEFLIRRALAIDEASHGAKHPAVATSLNNLALLLRSTSRWAEAELLTRRALALDESSYGPDHPSVARDLNNLALLLQDMNRLDDAEPLFRRAVKIVEASANPNHPDVAPVISNLALALMQMNRLAEAEPLMRRAATLWEDGLGADHPDVAVALNNLGLLLQATNRLSEAEPLMRRVLDIWEHSFGTDHPNVATALNNLGRLLQSKNRTNDAEPLMRRALAIDRGSYGPDHPDVARDLSNLAELLYMTGRLSEAEPLMRSSLATWTRSLGPNHPNVATALNNLAQLLQADGRLLDAEPLMRRALAIDEASHGPDHPDVARDVQNLAGLLHATDRSAEAESLMRRALAGFLTFHQATGHAHPYLEIACKNYLELMRDMGWGHAEAQAQLQALAARFGITLGAT